MMSTEILPTNDLGGWSWWCIAFTHSHAKMKRGAHVHFALDPNLCLISTESGLRWSAPVRDSDRTFRVVDASLARPLQHL